MPATFDFPVGHPPDFPEHCVRCGREPTSTWKCQRTQGIDLIFAAWWKWYTCEVPVCGRCLMRRRVLGVLSGAALFVILIALVAMSLSLMMDFKQAGLDDRIPFGVVMALLFGAVWYIRNRHSALADRILLGVELTYFSTAHNIATLWIRDQRYAPRFEPAASPSIPPTALPNAAASGSPDPNPYRAPAALNEPIVPVELRPVVSNRRHAAGLMAGGVVMLLLNHQTFADGRGFYPGLVIGGPPCLLLGAVGLWKPELLRAFQSRGVPGRMRLISALTIATGLAAGVYLLAAVYQ